MSIRAYIVLKTECEIDELNGEEVLKSIKYEAFKPLFNVSYSHDWFDFISTNGWDETSDDCCGRIGIYKDDWIDAINNIDPNRLQKLKEADDGYGEQVIAKVNEWFKDHDDLELNCY